MKALRRTALALAVTLLPLAAAWGADAGAGTKLTLDDCIKKALTAAPELGEAQADIDATSARLDEAKAHRYPQIEFLGLIGPVPQARGNQVYSEDGINDTERWTWFQRGDATLVQPLYTFGKISENMRAATHGIEVDRAKKDQKGTDVALQVKEYYYGILLARELRELVLETRDILDDAKSKARKLIDKGSPNADELDIYKLDAFRGEVAKYLEEASKGEQLALAALKTRMGLPPAEAVDIDAERLQPAGATLGDLAAYVEEARTRRPEFRQLNEGIKAREALVEAAKANYWPDLFLGGYVSAAYADKRTRIDNPFVPDDFNHVWAGIALGVKWKLDFGITGAKVAGERAQYNRLLSTRAYADEFIPLQIRKAWLEARESEASAAAMKEAYTNAKRWVVASVANYDFGIGPAQEIFDGLQNYARMRAAYFQAVYNQNMALARLDHAVGQAPLN